MWACVRCADLVCGYHLAVARAQPPRAWQLPPVGTREPAGTPGNECRGNWRDPIWSSGPRRLPTYQFRSHPSPPSAPSLMTSTARQRRSTPLLRRSCGRRPCWKSGRVRHARHLFPRRMARRFGGSVRSSLTRDRRSFGARQSSAAAVRINSPRGYPICRAQTHCVPRADDLGNYKRCRRDDIILNRMRAFQGGI